VTNVVTNTGKDCRPSAPSPAMSLRQAGSDNVDHRRYVETTQARNTPRAPQPRAFTPERVQYLRAVTHPLLSRECSKKQRVQAIHHDPAVRATSFCDAAISSSARNRSDSARATARPNDVRP
jgi:hypothetical protein